MKEIVEDTISRNKKFQEEMQKRVKRLKELYKDRNPHHYTIKDN